MKKFILFTLLILIFIACESHSSKCERVGAERGWEDGLIEFCKKNQEFVDTFNVPEEDW